MSPSEGATPSPSKRKDGVLKQDQPPVEELTALQRVGTILAAKTMGKEGKAKPHSLVNPKRKATRVNAEIDRSASQLNKKAASKAPTSPLRHSVRAGALSPIDPTAKAAMRNSLASPTSPVGRASEKFA